MRFALGVFALFFGGMMLLKNGFNEDGVTALFGLSCIILAEICKPEKETLKAFAWMKANLKWICLPLAALFIR